MDNITQHLKTEATGLKKLTLDVLGWSLIPVKEVSESFTSHKIGQSALDIVDKLLWIVEKTSEWAVPVSTDDEDNAEHKKSPVELTRPLPWIVFLPTLLFLRIMKEGISFGALLIGKQPLRPDAFVSFIQDTRKSLKSIKNSGIHNATKSKSIVPAVVRKSHIYESIVSAIDWLLLRIRSMFCFNEVKYFNNKETIAITRKHTPKGKKSNGGDDLSQDSDDSDGYYLSDPDQPEDERAKMNNRNARKTKANGSTDMRAQKHAAENFLDSETGKREDDLNNSINQDGNEHMMSYG